MTEKIEGGCLCGKVNFQLNNEFDTFYFCHCKQCRHLTGSAFAANVFTAVDNIEWITGLDSVLKFSHPSRSFSNAFCSHCGSALPVVTKSKASLLVPVGCLHGEPNIMPQANIFNSERVDWLDCGNDSKRFEGFPTQ